jgi:hypothetical protein
MQSQIISINKRGRPIGFRLSEESKRSISDSKRGQRHREETKDKISRSLVIYFKRQNPLSEELVRTYCRFNDDLCDWFDEYSDDIDSYEDVLTQKAMQNTRKTELSYGNDIEYFSHGLTPEIIALYVEHCEQNDLDPVEYLDTL